jgi:hypothetical protein
MKEETDLIIIRKLAKELRVAADEAALRAVKSGVWEGAIQAEREAKKWEELLERSGGEHIDEVLG